MRRSMLGISQGAASAVALAATAFIIAFALSAQLPALFAVQKAGSEQAGEAEKLAAVRLSLVAAFEDGTVIIANDGVTPVTIDKLYTPGGAISLTSPITIQPGQKVSINLGRRADALAVQLPSGQKVVLKEKPGLEVATITSSVNPTSSTTTSTTRTTTTSTVTSHRTTHTTQNTPFTVTRTTSVSPSYIVTTIYTEVWHWYHTCYTQYYVPTTATVTVTTLIVQTSTTTARATATVRYLTTTSTNTETNPHTVWVVTSIITTIPTPTTVNTVARITITTPLYTYGAWYLGYYGYCTYYTYRVVSPTSTLFVRVTETPSVVRTTTTVS